MYVCLCVYVYIYTHTYKYSLMWVKQKYKQSPKSPEIGGRNHSQMGGLLICYPHYTIMYTSMCTYQSIRLVSWRYFFSRINGLVSLGWTRGSVDSSRKTRKIPLQRPSVGGYMRVWLGYPNPHGLPFPVQFSIARHSLLVSRYSH